MINSKVVWVDDSAAYRIDGHDWFEFYAENEAGKTIDHLVCDLSKNASARASKSFEMDDPVPTPSGG